MDDTDKLKPTENLRIVGAYALGDEGVDTTVRTRRALYAILERSSVADARTCREGSGRGDSH